MNIARTPVPCVCTRLRLSHESGGGILVCVCECVSLCARVRWDFCFVLSQSSLAVRLCVIKVSYTKTATSFVSLWIPLTPSSVLVIRIVHNICISIGVDGQQRSGDDSMLSIVVDNMVLSIK